MNFCYHLKLTTCEPLGALGCESVCAEIDEQTLSFSRSSSMKSARIIMLISHFLVVVLFFTCLKLRLVSSLNSGKAVELSESTFEESQLQQSAAICPSSGGHEPPTESPSRLQAAENANVRNHSREIKALQWQLTKREVDLSSLLQPAPIPLLLVDRAEKIKNFFVGAVRDVGRRSGGRAERQTTTILLFTEPYTDGRPSASLTRYSSLSSLKDSKFNPAKPTVVLIHGYMPKDIRRQQWAIDLKDLVLAKGGGGSANVFYADWSHYASLLNYFSAVEHMVDVAQDISALLSNLAQAFRKFNKNNIHVVGHSLGAHVAGLLGQEMGRELNQITGLDPAGVALKDMSSSKKLSQDDARFVAAYHTDSDFLGTVKLLADRDVFVNGGSEQPGCARQTNQGGNRGIFESACSHRFAVSFVAARMGKCVMVAYECKTYARFLAGHCGFCRQSNSTSGDCVGVGLDWQYQLRGPHNSTRPEHFDKKKSRLNVAWAEAGARYFVKTGPSKPHCLFTYQLVLRLTGAQTRQDAAASELPSSLELILRANNNNSSLLAETGRVRLTNQLESGRRLEVFAGEAGKTSFVAGKNVYTGLLSVGQDNSKLYDRMPLKFNEASLAGGSAKRGKFELFVNFMSHVSYKERERFSGPVRVKAR